MLELHGCTPSGQLSRTKRDKACGSRMSYMMQPTIVLLKEGTDTSQGKAQLLSNINACQAITNVLRTTLGPRGMDKLIHDKNGVTISNDGATIVKLLDIVHPAAKTLVDVAKAQDDEVGDGTTSVCLLSGEFLRMAKPFVEEGVHPQTIIQGYRLASELCLKRIKELAVRVKKGDQAEKIKLLERCAATALNSKLIADQKDFFAPLVVEAICFLDPADLDLNLIGIKKVAGGSVTDSLLVKGVAFKKTFSYAGFEQQPKYFKNPKILSLNVELELKSEKSNAEVRITNVEDYQSIVDAEWKIIYDKLEKITKSGAQIVLSRLPIGDLATQYFADRKIFCAGRVPQEDLLRVGKATGAVIQTSLNDLSESILGTCETFEEKQIGGERYNLFTGCQNSHTATLILRGGAEQFIAETERSLHDALMIVKRTIQHDAVVGGGGSIEMELSKFLRAESRKITDKRQLIIQAYAKALEVIPRQLTQNAGFDNTEILSRLRAAHAKGETWAGVDIENEGILDTMKAFIWEPALVRQNAISAATEAACLILSVDETVRNAKSEGLPDQGSQFMGH